MKRLYVDFHVIQTVPPSCVNRDDTGRPKTAIYGGVNRARVSSQSWKHEMRKMFTEIFHEEQLGKRTLHAVRLIKNYLEQDGIEEEQANEMAKKALEKAGITVNSKNKTEVMFFISNVQAKELAELIKNEGIQAESETNNDVKEKKAKKSKKDKEKKADSKYQDILKVSQSIDIALFGRMVAKPEDLSIDAASQVAHSISTHAVQSEYDYFTAVDDLSNSSGAGHLGTKEFNSATLYRYATVNVLDLFKTLKLGIKEELFEAVKADTANCIKGFAEAFICSMPTGSQNSYANRTLPDLVYVTVRTDQPVNLSGAFEMPIKSKEGYAEKSVEALSKYAKKIYDDYCGTPAHSFVIGSDSFPEAEKVNLSGLLEQLYNYISNGVI